MNRRSFLSLFGSAAAVAAVKPTYFFAPVGGWKSLPRYSFRDVNGIYAPVIPVIKIPSFEEIHAQLVVNWKEAYATLIDPPSGGEFDTLFRGMASRYVSSYELMESALNPRGIVI